MSSSILNVYGRAPELFFFEEMLNSNLLKTKQLLIKRTPRMWPLPGRWPESKVPKVLYGRVTRARAWPHVNWLCDYVGLVSEPFAGAIRDHVDPRTYQLFPVRIDQPKTERKYFLLNLFNEIDALNIRASRALPSNDPPREGSQYSLTLWYTGHKPVLDPDRIPAGMNFFTAKYLSCYRFIAGPLADWYLKTKPHPDEYERVPCRREPEGPRRRWLADLRRRTNGIDAVVVHNPKMTMREAGLLLALDIPRWVRWFYDNRADLTIFSLDLHTPCEVARRTWDLRSSYSEWLPFGYVAIAADGRGGDFLLDTTRSHRGDCPVLYADHELLRCDRNNIVTAVVYEEVSTTFRRWIERVAAGENELPETRMRRIKPKPYSYDVPARRS